MKRLEAVIDNLKKQNELSKRELEQSTWALEENKRVSDELAKANK